MKLAVFFLGAALLFAAGPPYAITNAKIAAPDSTIAEGTILMRDGLIEAVGAGIAIPSDARIFDAKGAHRLPRFDRRGDSLWIRRSSSASRGPAFAGSDGAAT